MCIVCTCPHCRRMWFYIVQVIRSHSTQHNNQWPVHYHQLYQSSPTDLKWHAAPCWEHLWGWIHQGPFEIQSAWGTNGNRAFRFSEENVFNVWLSVPFTQRWHWHVCHVFPQSVPAQIAGNFPAGLTVKFMPFTRRCILNVGISQSCWKISSGIQVFSIKKETHLSHVIHWHSMDMIECRQQGCKLYQTERLEVTECSLEPHCTGGIL